MFKGCCVLALALCLVSPTWAAESDDQLSLADLNDRVEQLEQSTPSWLEKITLKGDFRYRFEHIDMEDTSNRNRHRFRFRFFVGAEVNELVDLGLQFASGSEDPVSTNQSFDNGWDTKRAGIDLAYFDYHPINKESLELNVVGGKMKTPFAVMSKSELLWDPDIRPEGMVVNFSSNCDDSINWFGHAGLFYLEERSTAADSRMVGGQLGVVVGLNDCGSVTAGAGYYDFGQLEGRPSLFDDTDAAGNSATKRAGLMLYNDDYNELELFAEFATEIESLPVHVFGNWVNNRKADDEDKGWLAGVKVGKVKEFGTWDFRYQYKHIEQDAVVGAFTDSDFGGGGTNSKGHEFNVGFGLGDDWKLALSYFLNETGIASGQTEMDYDRYQIDLKFKF